MSYRVNSGFYQPKTKADLLGAIKPYWNGSKTELGQYSIQRLRAVWRTVYNAAYDKAMTKKLNSTIDNADGRLENPNEFERGVKGEL